MAKIVDPVQFSDYFGLDSAQLDVAGVLNPTLNVDTRLFIDPLLFEQSRWPEIKHGARTNYNNYFTTVIKLLRASQSPNDVPWRNAFRLLSFPEVKWTCLGYGAASVAGSGSGTDMTRRIVQTAKDIVSLGIEDPDLFVAMALFEEGFGPDRISDMAANVILENLLNFTVSFLKNMTLPCEEISLCLRNGKKFNVSLPINPYINGKNPVILVPTDILRALPIARDKSDIADVTIRNEEIRNRVNAQIAEIWKETITKDKRELRHWALSGKDPFETLLAILRAVPPKPYDIKTDPMGEIFWRKLAATLAEQESFKLQTPVYLNIDGVVSVVEKIIEQFQFLIEERRFSEELYSDGRPRPEKAAQRLFFAVAHAYCKANNLDLTPEAETGNGPVDFKVASGYTGRVLVEIKLSTNGKLVKGYERQLDAYLEGEEALKGYYLVIDVGRMGKKSDKLLALKNDANSRGQRTSEIVFVDGSRRPSASRS